VDPAVRTSAALAHIDAALARLMGSVAGEANALAVYMPPQEGKSQLCARALPEWALYNDPTLRIAIISYEQDVAVRWGRDIRLDIRLAPDVLPIELRTDSNAAGRWETPQGGGVYCVGIGGPLTGRPVDLLIVDDPVKDREAAESEKLRNRAWHWWEEVALTRLAPGAKVAVVQTRWHEDDLGGRIEARPSPLRWEIIRIPAIADRPDDPLGRPVGGELVSVRGREPGFFRTRQATIEPYSFSALYQQAPTAPEGNMFRRAAFRYWEQAEPWPGDYRERISLDGLMVTLADCWRFATVDVAASTRDTADYTVVSVWAITPEGHLVLLDRHRQQIDTHDHFAMAEPLLRRWDAAPMYVERGYFASALVTDARDKGWPIAEVIADTDKVTRAIPAAGRVHSHRVWFPSVTTGCPCGSCLDGNWLKEWEDELAQFPSTGAHDDQVDTLSYAVKIQIMQWQPAASHPARPAPSAHDQVVAAAHSAATGNGHGDLDIMSVPY
jgi:predicted phage terminase large subunit-like protein